MKGPTTNKGHLIREWRASKDLRRRVTLKSTLWLQCGERIATVCVQVGDKEINVEAATGIRELIRA